MCSKGGGSCREQLPFVSFALLVLFVTKSAEDAKRCLDPTIRLHPSAIALLSDFRPSIPIRKGVRALAQHHANRHALQPEIVAQQIDQIAPIGIGQVARLG